MPVAGLSGGGRERNPERDSVIHMPLGNDQNTRLAA